MRYFNIWFKMRIIIIHYEMGQVSLTGLLGQVEWCLEFTLRNPSVLVEVYIAVIEIMTKAPWG